MIHGAVTPKKWLLEQGLLIVCIPEKTKMATFPWDDSTSPRIPCQESDRYQSLQRINKYNLKPNTALVEDYASSEL